MRCDGKGPAPLDPFPHNKQNAAPTTWEIIQLLCRHPDRADAEKFCVDADEVELADHLECFWD